MNRRKQSIDNLKNVANQTKILLESLSGSSEKLSTKNTSTLFGLLGGLIGTVFGILLDLKLGASIPIAHFVIYSVLTALGTTLGTICYRGIRRMRLEKCMEENKLVYDEFLNKIKMLPKNAPDNVRNELWTSLINLQRSQEVQIEKLLGSSKKENASISYSKDKTNDNKEP